MKKRKNAAAVALRQIGLRKIPKAVRSELARNAANARWAQHKAAGNTASAVK